MSRGVPVYVETRPIYLHFTIERYHRPDLAHLNIDVTMEDPGTFTKPVERHVTWLFTPGEDVLEAVCAENNRFLENSGLK